MAMKLLSRNWVGSVAFAVMASTFAVGSVVGKTDASKPATLRPANKSFEQTAHRVDELIVAEVFKPDTRLAPKVDDATYLRRVWLDIIGDIPTPEHVTAFVLDPAKDKRERVVDELLANPQYGQNWARYWRDVILSRKLEDRAGLVANSLVVSLTG